jgi:hypothetical protein
MSKLRYFCNGTLPLPVLSSPPVLGDLACLEPRCGVACVPSLVWCCLSHSVAESDRVSNTGCQPGCEKQQLDSGTGGYVPQGSAK